MIKLGKYFDGQFSTKFEMGHQTIWSTSEFKGMICWKYVHYRKPIANISGKNLKSIDKLHEYSEIELLKIPIHKSNA